MTAHFLAITPESYDSSVVHGVYDTLESAQQDIDRRVLLPEWFSSFVEIQEWDGRVQALGHWEWWRTSGWEERAW